jgi:hypothetical protein
MHEKTRRTLITESNNQGLAIDNDFAPRVDDYMQKHFAAASSVDKLVVESYLVQAAIRIAKVEGKSRLQGEDFKAAVWLFHQPEQPNDPCSAAGARAMAAERSRSLSTRGLLLESFAKAIDEEKRGGTGGMYR